MFSTYSLTRLVKHEFAPPCRTTASMWLSQTLISQHIGSTMGPPALRPSQHHNPDSIFSSFACMRSVMVQTMVTDEVGSSVN
jgi:hypothetical protein